MSGVAETRGVPAASGGYPPSFGGRMSAPFATPAPHHHEHGHGESHAAARPIDHVHAGRRKAGVPGRLDAGPFLAVLAVVGLLIVFSTDQVVPPTTAHQADVRIWLAARATGFMTLGLLTMQIVLGLILSHPTNKTTWRLSRLLFPWHENAWIFVLAFLAAHIVATVADAYADVGLLGALVPGMSHYRTPAIALGTLSLYALLATGLTARYTKLLPRGLWLWLHRFGLVVLALAWAHGLLSGTDSVALAAVYGGSFALVVAASAYRYWVVRNVRTTFAASLPKEDA
jgi:sulfoxide reductase heme-binding subunit YedZ